MFDSMAVQKILKEDTEITIEVTDEDVTTYAEQLGIDVSKEKHLLWIARKGLETPVPTPWCPVEDEKGRIYYYNRVTDKSTWEHPADDYFRKLVKQERDKQTISKGDPELGIESEPSSLDDVPPISSAKNSTSAQIDENNLKTMGRRKGLLHKLHEFGKEENSGKLSYLKSNSIGDKFNSRSFNNDIDYLGKRSHCSDPLLKISEDNSLIFNHSNDDDLSTGLDGIGFDRFADQYGIMDASQLSPVMLSSQVDKTHSYIKLASQPMPKSLLKTLFDTSNDPDESSSEAKKSENLSFADFLKEAEEYSNKSLRTDNPQSENNLEENPDEHHTTKDVSSSSVNDNSVNECSEQEEIHSSKKLDSFANYNEKFKHDVHTIEDCWKRKLEETEKEIRLNHEKQIAELQEKFAEEKRIEETKLKDSILLMKEENAVILSKQELVLTEELEADLESAKEEIEMKKLTALQAIQEQEEMYTKELEERKVEAKQIFDSKVQDLCLEMEKLLEGKKQDIQSNHQQEIDALTEEHAKKLEELENNFQLRMEKLLEGEKQDIQSNHQQEIDTLTEEHAKKLEELENNFQLTVEKMEEKRQEIQHDHQQKIDVLTKEYANEFEELKNNYQNDMKFSNEVISLKEELNSLKEQIAMEKQALEQLQETKQSLEENKIQLLELLQEKEMLKHNNEEERDKLLEESNLLQNKLTELQNEITEHNQILQGVAAKKCALETEVTFINEELNKQKSLLQQPKQSSNIISVDKCTDTSDLCLKDDNISENAKSKCDSELSFKYEPEKEAQNSYGQFASSVGENDIPLEEDKMDKLEIKIVSLEKAFKLLETKIGNTVDPMLLYGQNSHSNNKKILKSDEKCECCNKTIHGNFSSGLDNNAQQLFNCEELKNSSYLQNTSDNKYSVFYIPNNASDTQHYENNVVYNMYSKDLCQQEMNLALSPVYISENDTEFVPFSRSDTAIQLKHCKEKFKNLQAKHQTSQLNLELIKKDIFNDISRKDTDSNDERQNLNYQQIPEPVYDASQLGSQYIQNVLPPSTVTSVITFPTNRTVQNDVWHSSLWQNAQKFIQKEEEYQNKANSPYVLIEGKENNPLDQFFTLTETVLDKELELFSTDKVEKHYLSSPALNEGNSSNSFFNSELYDKLEDSNMRNITSSGLYTNYRSVHNHQPMFLDELITQKEDWTEKIRSMYQRIRGYERDLILKRSLKANI